MKRFTLILALVLLVTLPMMAERVTPETARKVAAIFLNNNGTKNTQLTDLSKEAGFPNLYIFNGNPGFVVMAADDCVQPILGYSLTGNFVVENMPTNVSGWLQGYNDEIQFAIDNKIISTTETTQLWTDLAEGNSKAAKATIVVDALIQTTWDQDPGYNDLCPYDSNAGELTVTGCVATAMAQIMRYWEYPSSGTGSHSYTPSNHPEYGVQSVNYANATYDWTDMPLHSPNAEIAKLMYHCGVSVDMMYGIGNEGGSGAYSNDIPYALTTYFRYKTGVSFVQKRYYNSDNWLNLIKTELNAGRPVEYNGSGNGSAHAFICDGYDDSNYFHFNWGWSGANDGFYSLSSLNPGSGGSGGGSYSFTQNQSAVIGIQPQDCAASAPTNFSIVKEGRNAVLTWTAASNAVSYYIYRNGLLVANTASATFTDSNLSYGEYAYYVKSVDSNGAKSSPTATITIAIEPVASNLTVTKNGNDAVLTWTEPEWCMPSIDDEVLTYSYGSTIYNFGSGGSSKLYYGHRYPASLISSNKVLYKVSFCSTYNGAYKLYVYTANSGNNKPQTQVYTQDVTVSVAGWNDIVLSTPLQLDDSKDLWVFIYDPVGRDYPIKAGAYEGSNSNGNYISTSTPTTSVSIQSVVMLINTYITDGSFNYNVYDNNTSIATNLSGTTYTVSNIGNNAAYQYTLKTNFHGGVTEASNMAGLVLGEASLSSLMMSTNDQMTITEGSKLTVSGTLSDVNPANLILENGAQLVNSSSGVQATVKKDITAYSGDGGWILLASPIVSVTPTVNNGLIANNYDLYYYDQTEQLEWRNYEAQSFDIYNKVGYLYANSGNPTLSFVGTLVANTAATTLVYDSNADFPGFNLIGNPYPCNTYLNRSFYILNSEGSNFTLGNNNNPIPPCAAVLVQAQSTGESVTFSKNASRIEPTISLTVAEANMRGNAVIDQARVSFNEKDQLAKFTLNGQNSWLYIPQNGQDFAVAYINSQNEMPVNFKATRNGTYTLSVENQNLELDYLHLIDNLTGNNVDLLATPTYTFEAKTTDYASRFRLVFSSQAPEPVEGPSTPFAYYNGSEWVVTGTGTLQVIDILGRPVLTKELSTLNSQLSTLNYTPGLYVLRLITNDGIQTQKIVIE